MGIRVALQLAINMWFPLASLHDYSNHVGREMTNAARSLLDAGTSTIADVFDANDLRPPVLFERLIPLKGGTRFAGPAFTIEGRSETWTNGGDPNKLAAIDAMPPDCVPVWAGGNIRGVCCFGDLLATAMSARRCAGVIVDGGVRDTSYLQELDLPIVARYRSPAQAIGRWRVTGFEKPVHVRGAIDDWVTIGPGDIVVMDDDGCVVVPIGLVERIAEQALAWAKGEVSARADIAAGMPLLTAFHTHGHL